jgi:monoamine oxidase
MFQHVGHGRGEAYFAGEYTSMPFVMEGAVKSGVRIAHEIGAA